jgi:Arc/MetJ family transcription regulator
VYAGVLTRTNIDIDDGLIDRAMRLYRLRSKREAVDLALRKLVGEPMTREEMLSAEGRGWGGDLDEMRAPDQVPAR